MPRQLDRAYYMKKLRALVAIPDDPQKVQEVEDLLGVIYGVGYTHGYKDGESSVKGNCDG